MADISQPIVPMRECVHIGFDVKNLEKAIDFFSSVFGWGPWERWEAERKGFFAWQTDHI